MHDSSEDQSQHAIAVDKTPSNPHPVCHHPRLLRIVVPYACCRFMLFRLDFPPGAAVELVLYKNVRNAADVRRAVVSGELAVAALKASLVRPEP